MLIADAAPVGLMQLKNVDNGLNCGSDRRQRAVYSTKTVFGD